MGSQGKEDKSPQSGTQKSSFPYCLLFHFGFLDFQDAVRVADIIVADFRFRTGGINDDMSVFAAIKGNHGIKAAQLRKKTARAAMRLVQPAPALAQKHQSCAPYSANLTLKPSAQISAKASMSAHQTCLTSTSAHSVLKRSSLTFNLFRQRFRRRLSSKPAPGSN